MPSFAKRDPADLPLQLLDALVDLRLVQPELQRCHRSGLLRRRGRRGNGAWFPASSVLLTLAADALGRLVLLWRFALPARRRWRAWAGQLVGRRCGHIPQALISLPSFGVYANLALSAPLGPACSGRHSPRSGLPPARVRRLPLKERCLDTAISTQTMRQIPVDRPKYRAAAAHHFKWHPPLDLAHRFTPQTDGKTDFAGFCPLLSSHSPSCDAIREQQNRNQSSGTESSSSDPCCEH